MFKKFSLKSFALVLLATLMVVSFAACKSDEKERPEEKKDAFQQLAEYVEKNGVVTDSGTYGIVHFEKNDVSSMITYSSSDKTIHFVTSSSDDLETALLADITLKKGESKPTFTIMFKSNLVAEGTVDKAVFSKSNPEPDFTFNKFSSQEDSEETLSKSIVALLGYVEGILTEENCDVTLKDLGFVNY